MLTRPLATCSCYKLQVNPASGSINLHWLFNVTSTGLEKDYVVWIFFHMTPPTSPLTTPLSLSATEIWENRHASAFMGLKLLQKPPICVFFSLFLWYFDQHSLTPQCMRQKIMRHTAKNSTDQLAKVHFMPKSIKFNLLLIAESFWVCLHGDKSGSVSLLALAGFRLQG